MIANLIEGIATRLGLQHDRSFATAVVQPRQGRYRPRMNSVESCRRAGEMLARAEAVVVLTGAGISTESGIPDFRSPGGLWDRYDPTKLTFDRFCASAETRRDYWRLATETYPLLTRAEPNPAHLAVAAIEASGRLLKLVTQNIDGLHQRAGNSEQRTVEIHGSSLKAHCIDCGRPHDRAELHRRLLAGEIAVPECEACGGRVKPSTISFGQAMPEKETAEAFDAARDCDLMIVVGSSLQVYPAAALPDEAVRSGASLVIVNREPTPKDENATVIVRGSAAETMSLILKHAGDISAGFKAAADPMLR